MFNTNNEVVGVAFSGLDHADGIGYMVPARTVLHFLEGAAVVVIGVRFCVCVQNISVTLYPFPKIFVAMAASLAACVRWVWRFSRWKIARCAWRDRCRTR